MRCACGSLYFLNYRSREQASVALTKEDFWQRRYGHLCGQNLRKLAVNGLVDGFDFDGSKQISFCESSAEEKLHRSPFPVSGGTGAKEPLHTDVCGKLNTKSINGAEYFLTFTDVGRGMFGCTSLGTRMTCSLSSWSGRLWLRSRAVEV